MSLLFSVIISSKISVSKYVKSATGSIAPNVSIVLSKTPTLINSTFVNPKEFGL